MGILSVCPSVTTRYRFKPREIETPGLQSSPYDSLEYLVSYEVIWCHWVRRFPSNEGIKQGYTPLETVILPLLAHLVKTVADRHRLAAYHNKHCWRAFRWYQHQWPWMTLNPQNMGFKWFFFYFRLWRTLKSEFSLKYTGERPRQPAYEV